ncbi:MAG: NADH-quinone oxidoreductase subunit M, partial [candidate division NC10 bacterium]
WRFNMVTADMQFVQQVPWIPAIGVSYYVGLDGISLWLVLLTTLLSAISVLASWGPITERVKEYMVFMLLLETGMLGVFLALDFFLFYVFWEVMLVPMYFLIGVWGGPRKLYAAIKFFLFTLFGSVLMLLGILAIFSYHHAQTGEYTFNIFRMVEPGLPPNLQWWVWLSFFIAFAIKVPMFPFHTWLPDAHVEAPTAGSVILAGVLLKMGTYGFLRFSLPMLPDASREFIWLIVVLSVIAIIYGAMVSMVQPDMKKLIAYSSVSHMGFVTLGIFALNAQGIQGSILQMVNHGLSTGGLFLIVGLIYDRRHTRMIADLGGLSSVMPVYATCFAIIMLSSMGLPGLNGFVGEILILLGAFRVDWRWAAAGAIGIVLGAAYLLWLYQRTMFGPITHPENRTLTDLDGRELATLVPIIVLCFWIGLYPMPFLNAMAPSVNKVLQKVNAKALRAEAPVLPPALPAARPAEEAKPPR